MANTITAGNATNGGTAISSDTSGTLELKTGSTPTTALTISTGQVVTVVNPIQGGTITSGTAQATTSGTSIDFTGIPSWVKRITVMFSGVSSNGSSYKQIRFTDSVLKTSGYSSVSSLIYGNNLCITEAATTGFFIRSDGTTEVLNGCYVFNLLNSSTFLWTGFGIVSDPGGRSWQQSGVVTMASAVTAVRLTTVNGTDTFDAGSINILYE